jgi:outer membrane immunogenic protein
MAIKSTTTKIAIMLIATTAISTVALAADLPSRRAPPVFVPPPAIPVFTWTGLYIGAQAGYEFGRSNAFATNAVTGVGLAGNSANPNGVIGGGHIGYNFSTQSIPVLSGLGPFGGAGGVIGVEGDVDGSNYRSNYLLGGIANTTREDIQGSIRGRLGIAVDRALFYATGGVAFGDLRNNYLNTLTGLTDSYSHTRVGYTVGGGIEYAITNNFSLRAEYRYTDYGSFSDNLANSTAGGVNVRHRETDNRVQGGFSYKFDAFSPVAAPVVARY